MTAPELSTLDGRANLRVHRHYENWQVGDGVKTEFFLDKTFERVEDVEAFVDGLKKRPSSRGTAFDFQLRGLTSGYNGDRNAVKFTAAPANGVNVCVRVTSA